MSGRLEDLEAAPRDFDAVLVLGPEPVYVGERSLDVMWRAIESGAEEVRPIRADSLETSEPLRTLSDYERLERSFLERAHREPGSDAASGERRPIALLSAARARGAERDGGDGLLRRGLCHVFIDYFGETRMDVMELLPPRVSLTKVLEIGCGRGATARYLERRFGCSVTGIELNPVVAAEAAESLDRVIHGDVQRAELDERFDLILALDVVEHVTSPEALLARFPGWLSPGGRAIVSIPNVGHHAVVGDLLAGRWDYVPVGLLCYTHLRFFTRRSLESLCRRAKLDRFEIRSRKTPAPDWLDELPREIAGAPIDRESLVTEGFYIIISG